MAAATAKAGVPTEAKLLALAQQQLDIERQLRAMVEEEALSAQERFEHEQVYQKHCQDEKITALEKDLCQAQLENHQLRLEVHRWRKQHALVKLRLAGAQEDIELQQAHARQLEARCETLEAQRAALGEQAEALRGQVDELCALREEEAARLKEDLGHASEDQCRLTEQVRLATMRATAATQSARALEDALAAARRDADAAREQLAALRSREGDASTTLTRLQVAHDATKSELASAKKQLLNADAARVAAENAAEEASAAAAAAAERLVIKERELADFAAVDSERREHLKVKEAHLQALMEERINGLKNLASISEQRLLDQVAVLRRQLEQETDARMAQENEARRAAADAAAAAARVSALERQLASTQRAGVERDAALAQARAQLVQSHERLLEMEEEAAAPAPAAGGWRRAAFEPAAEDEPAPAQPRARAPAAAATKKQQAAKRAAAAAAARPRYEEEEEAAAVGAAQADEGPAADDHDDYAAGVDDDEDDLPAPAPVPRGKKAAGQQQQQRQQQRWQPPPSIQEEGDDNAEAPEPTAAKAAPRAALKPLADGANKPAFESRAAKAPIVGLTQRGAQAAAAQRQSLNVSNLLGKLDSGFGAGKPGGRKRKIAPLLPSVDGMSQVPASMLLGSDFTAPRLKRTN